MTGMFDEILGIILQGKYPHARQVVSSVLAQRIASGGRPQPVQRRKLGPKRTARKMIAVDDGIDIGNNVTYYPAPTNKGGHK
jgi:hypothetical protein